MPSASVQMHPFSHCYFVSFTLIHVKHDALRCFFVCRVQLLSLMSNGVRSLTGSVSVSLLCPSAGG